MMPTSCALRAGTVSTMDAAVEGNATTGYACTPPYTEKTVHTQGVGSMGNSPRTLTDQKLTNSTTEKQVSRTRNDGVLGAVFVNIRQASVIDNSRRVCGRIGQTCVWAAHVAWKDGEGVPCATAQSSATKQTSGWLISTVEFCGALPGARKFRVSCVMFGPENRMSGNKSPSVLPESRQDNAQKDSNPTQDVIGTWSPSEDAEKGKGVKEEERTHRSRRRYTQDSFVTWCCNSTLGLDRRRGGVQRTRWCTNTARHPQGPHKRTAYLGLYAAYLRRSPAKAANQGCSVSIQRDSGLTANTQRCPGRSCTTVREDYKRVTSTHSNDQVQSTVLITITHGDGGNVYPVDDCGSRLNDIDGVITLELTTPYVL